MKSAAALAVFTVLLGSCNEPNPQPLTPEKIVTEKPFVPGGDIEMQLEGGDYAIRASADNQIHVAFAGNIGNAGAELTTDNRQARVSVTNTPHTDFHVSIQVPASSNLVVHISGGDLKIGGISGSKNVTSGAGNVEISVGDPSDYSSADGEVEAGNLNARIFGTSRGGLMSHFTWQGHGKYTLHARLGAGNLTLER